MIKIRSVNHAALLGQMHITRLVHGLQQVSSSEGQTTHWPPTENWQYPLTHLLPVYEYTVLWNHALSHYFCTTLQLHNSPVNCAWELFKSLKALASLLVCNGKFFSVLDYTFFVGDIVSGVDLGLFGQGYRALSHHCKREVFQVFIGN